MPFAEHDHARSDYRTYLATFTQAWERYQQDPTSQTAALLRAGKLALAQELEQSGKFPLGLVVATSGAVTALAEAQHLPAEFLLRHKHGDWGELDPDDVRTNDYALRHEQRLLSAYHTRLDTKPWVITEWDRSVTTLLLPDEY
jgi:hypothetical protein